MMGKTAQCGEFSIDGEELAQLMIDHDSGVSPVIKYEVKRCYNDYYREE
jgi:restriction endonuclease Mrr